MSESLVFNRGDGNEADVWDDSLILKIYHESISSHVTSTGDEQRGQTITINEGNSNKINDKKKKKRKVEFVEDKCTKEDYRTQAKAGEWVPCKEITFSSNNSQILELGEVIDEITELEEGEEIENDVKSDCKSSEVVEQTTEVSAIADSYGNYFNQLHSTYMNNAVANDPSITSDDKVQGALQELLQAWYQVGYATGKYQTLLSQQNSK